MSGQHGGRCSGLQLDGSLVGICTGSRSYRHLGLVRLQVKAVFHQLLGRIVHVVRCRLETGHLVVHALRAVGGDVHPGDLAVCLGYLDLDVSPVGGCNFRV